MEEERPRDRERDREERRDDRDRKGRDDGERRRRSRSRSRSRDRRRRSRSRERRRSRSRDRRRSRSPEYDPEKQRRRPTWFDIPPIGGAPPPLTQLPGAVQVFSVPQSMAPAAGSGPVISGASAMSQQATRHARRIYVGGLPPSANEQNVQTFFSNALAAVGGTTAGPGLSVVNVYLNYEKKFAFVEFRTVEEASNAMALDGIMFEGGPVRIRRPADYNAAAAAPLGPSMPNPNLNLAAIGLDKQTAAAAPVAAAAPIDLAAEMFGPGGVPPAMAGQPGMSAGQVMHQQHISGPDAANRIFIGGLPYYLNEEQCRELLGAFGEIKSFDLIKDRQTGQSKGYGFCVYMDPAITDVAIAGLHGMQMGDRNLTVKRANSAVQAQQAQQAGGAPVPAPAAPAPQLAGAIRVVKLMHAVTPEELADDGEYNDIVEDMREECGKYGRVLAVHIPRPGPPDAPPPRGLGNVIIEFTEYPSAMAARNAMHGRKFGGRVVEAVLMGEADYNAQNWD
ncbi:splicing factor U2af large subunit A-like isoform X1 [Chlorella sorokiniana]|uniref:Splicing factor U2af large subunit A-like isoform X1 n=1 Tax=Chlorella sorokiniana TaxID=3076 RepID=A0A2P6TS78_CHLSO|nr:splicing factor U2af large subunit A-like isoform X1 [Chlorella sorokiniana]|eukprot:PRW56919.1 splicing factor U2af large subunit A-like isoform X1 [Chlorella sorokiniana]